MAANATQVIADLTQTLTEGFKTATDNIREGLIYIELDSTHYQQLNEDGLSMETINKVHQLDRNFANSLQTAFGNAALNTVENKPSLIEDANFFAVKAKVGVTEFEVSLGTGLDVPPTMSMVNQKLDQDQLSESRSIALARLNELHLAALSALEGTQNESAS